MNINLLAIPKNEVPKNNSPIINIINNSFKIELDKTVKNINKEKQPVINKNNITTNKKVDELNNKKITKINNEKIDEKEKINENSLVDDINSLKNKILNINHIEVNNQSKINKNTNKTNPIWKDISNILSSILNKLNNKNSEHYKLTIESLKELTSLSGKLKLNIKNINKEIGPLLKELFNALTNIKPNNEKINQKHKAKLKELFHNLKTVVDKKINNKAEQNELFNSNKITQHASLSNSLKIKTIKNNTKTNSPNEQSNKEIIENQSNIQKVDNKLQHTAESDVNNNLDLKTKSSPLSQLKNPKGFNIDNPNELFNQIVNKATMAINNRRSEMLIKLEPQIMGNIRLKIVVEGKEVSGSFFVDNKAVKLFLEENISSLKTNIEKQGLELDNLNILLEDNSNKNPESKMTYNIENNTKRITNNIPKDEETITSQYTMPDWLAKEVNLVI